MTPELEFFDNPKDLEKMNTVLGWFNKHPQYEVIAKFLDLSTLKSAVICDLNSEPIVILYERFRTQVRFGEKIAKELKSAGINYSTRSWDY